MKPIRTLTTTLIALGMLAAFVGTANARSLSTSSQTFRAGFDRLDFISAFSLECPATLEGSLHSRTIAKVAGNLIGYITRAVLGRCIKGSATILTASLPWHVRYVGFEGTLPAIARLITTYSGSQFQIREPVFGATCLASGGIPAINYSVESRGALTSATITGTSPTNCGGVLRLNGTSNSLTVL